MKHQELKVGASVVVTGDTPAYYPDSPPRGIVGKVDDYHPLTGYFHVTFNGVGYLLNPSELEVAEE